METVVKIQLDTMCSYECGDRLCVQNMVRDPNDDDVGILYGTVISVVHDNDVAVHERIEQQDEDLQCEHDIESTPFALSRVYGRMDALSTRITKLAELIEQVDKDLQQQHDITFDRMLELRKRIDNNRKDLDNMEDHTASIQALQASVWGLTTMINRWLTKMEPE